MKNENTKSLSDYTAVFWPLSTGVSIGVISDTLEQAVLATFCACVMANVLGFLAKGVSE